jgi:predicted HicB family RNase H-like nuclease
MKNAFRYKGFLGSVYYSPEDECFHGRIEGIDDLVTFEGRSVDELKGCFRDAVEDYIELCRKAGKSAQKSYGGSFNIRISSDLHKRAVRKSISEGISLNRLVRRALEKEVGDSLRTPR